METNNIWFKDWFNSPHYHLLYKNRNEQEAEYFINNLLQNISFKKNAVLCDLACGKGRHAYMLSRHGHSVTGLDLSENSIAEAKKIENNLLHFAVHDMRRPFGANMYDGVFNLFTSFGYFNRITENKNVLKAIHHALKPNGKLVLDFFNADWVIKNLVPQEEKTIEGITFNIVRKATPTHILKEISFVAEKKEYHFTERVQLIKQKDFETLLQNANFAINTVWGDYSLGEYSQETSQRLIISASKKHSAFY